MGSITEAFSDDSGGKAVSELLIVTGKAAGVSCE